MQTSIVQSVKIVSFIDLGSNSVRMSIVKILPNGGTSVLNQAKHMVQLGKGAFFENILQQDAMERTLQVLLSFSLSCKSFHVDEIIAVATCAVRDASNGQSFMNEIFAKTGIAFSCISGDEEARLIYRGISDSFEKNSMLRLYLDIGGGSTEFVVGDSYNHKVLDSVKLGCVRLANMFPPPKSGKTSEVQFAEIQRYVRDVAKHAFGRIASYNLQEMVASSGTAQNLSLISAIMEHADRKQGNTDEILTYKNLVKTVKYLRSLTDEERRNVQGLTPNRVDLIIPGAAILQTVVEELGFDYIRISHFGLRDGLLREYLERHHSGLIDETASVQERSILKLARACRFEEEHARHVAKLCLRMFDSSKICDLHDMNKSFRDLLYFAALLHDIGIFISFSKHDMHGKYLITHHPLLGFNAKETNLLASLVGSHRLKNNKELSGLEDLDDSIKANAEKLSLYLKIAEVLDKCHGKYVDDAIFVEEKTQIKLIITHNEACPMEQEKMEQAKKNLRRVFLKDISVQWHLKRK